MHIYLKFISAVFRPSLAPEPAPVGQSPSPVPVAEPQGDPHAANTAGSGWTPWFKGLVQPKPFCGCTYDPKRPGPEVVAAVS